MINELKLINYYNEIIYSPFQDEKFKSKLSKTQIIFLLRFKRQENKKNKNG